MSIAMDYSAGPELSNTWEAVRKEWHLIAGVKPFASLLEVQRLEGKAPLGKLHIRLR